MDDFGLAAFSMVFVLAGLCTTGLAFTFVAVLLATLGAGLPATLLATLPATLVFAVLLVAISDSLLRRCKNSIRYGYGSENAGSIWDNKAAYFTCYIVQTLLQESALR